MTTQVATKYNVGGVLLDQPFKVRRLGHFGFNATKLDECLHFYTGLLGFRVSDPSPMGYFLRFGSDHHAFALFSRQVMEERAAAAGGAGRRYRPDVTINQITWQTQSLSEPVRAVDFFAERGVEIQRTGRDGAGSTIPMATQTSFTTESNRSAGTATPSPRNIDGRSGRRSNCRSSQSSTRSRSRWQRAFRRPRAIAIWIRCPRPTTSAGSCCRGRSRSFGTDP